MKFFQRLKAVALVALCLALSCSPSEERSTAAPADVSEGKEDLLPKANDFRYEGEVAAPDIPNGLDWFNVERPISIASDLRGKIVLLDFWTQGCINCLHVLPDLHRLEQEFPDSLAVVGVHWAKFDHERTTDAVRQAVLRLGVEHPVVNDDYEYLRRAYRVKAWPTLVLIDPLGRVVGSHAGEGIYSLFQPVIEQMSREYGTAGLINVAPVDKILVERDPIPTVLSFPGKLLADGPSDRLFVADSGHHRLVISTLEGQIVDAIGSGTPGLVDGVWEDARFREPQGMVLSENGRYLYVADRGNHAIRVVDLVQRTVRTLAGIGEPTFRVDSGLPLETAITSPWDVERVGQQLFVAGAGRHQIWVLELSGDGESATWLDVFAGTGAEGLDDGFRLSATLSQPSGLAVLNNVLWFTDPEASAVRSVNLDGDEQLETLIGEGLFVWGDETGRQELTRLQHAVGIEVLNDELYVADTYNHRIKSIDPENGASKGVAGNGIPGLSDGYGQSSQLAEPSGLSAVGATLYIADTNNHQVRTLDTRTRTLSTLVLSNQHLVPLVHRTAADEKVIFPQIAVAPGQVDLTVDLEVPPGYKFNEEGTFVMDVKFRNSGESSVVGASSYQAQGPEIPQDFELFIHEEDELSLEVDATVFYCPAVDATFCLLRHFHYVQPFTVSDAGVRTVTLAHRLPSSEELDLSFETLGG